VSYVTYEKNGAVATVSMSNPPAELTTAALMRELGDAITQGRADKVRAMVLRSDGKLFSGGVDVRTFQGLTYQTGREMLVEGMDIIAAFEDAPFPIIAAVHGMCAAAGLEFALACDLILAADDAQFIHVEAMIGAATFLGGVYRLAERCGPARAREIAYTADLYPAAKFAEWGIVNHLYPAAELHDRADELAQRIARGPALAHDVTKRMVREALAHGSRAADRYTLDTATWLFPTTDMQNAVSSLLENGARDFRAKHAELVSFSGEWTQVDD
jgi:enoyl-CoA hydratase/carnithine racemase